MLRAAINVHWSQKVTNKKLYNGLPKITKTIRYHRLKFSGHIWRHGEETTSNVIFCIPTNRKTIEEGHRKQMDYRGKNLKA